MKSDLDELIELLETEKQTLEDAIKNYIDEWEYLNAHYHSSALSNVDNQLNTLYRLKDPFYLEKQQLERTIEIYDSFINPNTDSYYKKKAEEEKEKLKKLNDQKGTALYDDQKIDDALFSLWAGINNGFVLYLNVKDNLGITFELSENDFIAISISVNMVLKADCFFSDDKKDPLNKFRALGFNLNYLGNRLIYDYNISNFKDAISVKLLLSRIIYDVFTYVEIDNPASLVYF